LAAILVLIFPSVVLDLIDGMRASLPTPPQGFDVRREGIEGGKVETVEYDSKAAGCARKMRVYTPPGFSGEQQYPVLYLLHGSRADEDSWVKAGRLDAILDNLYADKKAVPMIVVMPNGDPPAFGADMLGDVIPYVESHFPAQVGREHRALAGVSSGAHQALELGLAHPEMFAYLGAFIGGLSNCEQFEKEYQDALKDLGAKTKLKLLWVASVKNDTNYQDCQDTLRLFKKYNIPYIYGEGKGLHDWETARSDLFLFAPLVFRDRD
jgi:enterochelin esterase-like enzyme